MVDHTIKGKTVLIAGGAKNLGALVAHDLAAHGAKAIAIHYHSAATKPEAEKTLAALQAAGVKAVAFQADLTANGAVAKLFADTVAAIGRPDIAINTVGQVLKKPIAETTEAEFDAMFAVNTRVAYFFIKEAGIHLNDNGRLLTLVTSLLGAYTPFYSTYAGSKAAVEHFTRAASKEYGARGISVNAIGPGPMDTPFFMGRKRPRPWHTISRPQRFPLQPDRPDRDRGYSPYIRFIVSEGWWMTGQTILVNGGYTTK